MASTILQPGDIAIVGYTAGTSSTFSFVNLVPLAPETIIYFTDTGWDVAGNSFRGIDEDTPSGSEGLLKFVVKSQLAAGSVIRNIDAETATWRWETTDRFSQLYSFTNGRNGPEDQLLVFQSTNAANPLLSGSVTPIFQIDNTAGFEDAFTLNTGNILPTLIEGSTALRFHRTESRAAFKLDVLSGADQSEWLAAIANPNNWTFENTNTPLPNNSISVSLAELSFSASTFQVREDGSAIAAVTVVRGGDLGKAVSAQIRLTDGSAVAPADYMNALVTVELAANERSKIVTIPILNDTTIESDETLTLTLNNPSTGATIGSQNTATLTIVDEDAQLNFSAPTFQVREDGTASAAVTVTRTGRSTGTVGATISLSNGTAIAPGDYTSTPINVVFGDGEMSKVVTIPIVNDTLVESNETINLVLSNATGGATIGTQNTATLTIVEDDVQLAFSAPSFSVSEDGTPITAVTVTRAGRSTGTVGATVTLSNGTAIAPGDYTSTPITVVLGNGEMSKVVTIPVVNDALVENNETLNLVLSNATGGATLGTQNTATLTIVEDDVQLAFSAPSFSVNENGTPITAVTVTRTGRSSGVVAADLTFSNGTAIAPDDYTSTPIRVIFGAGEMSKVVSMPIINDALAERDETLNLTLTNPSPGVTLGTQNRATLTIVEDDVQLAFSAPNFSVNENGTPISAVTVTRTGRTSGTVGATISLSNGTAIAPADYNNTPISILFASGETSKTVEIPIFNDNLIESNETIKMSLIAPTEGVTIGTQSQATLTVVNDDTAQLAFSASSFRVREGDNRPVINVRRTGSTAKAVSAFVAISNGSATPGSDYWEHSWLQVDFLAGQSFSQNFFIMIYDDTLQEGDETINLRLMNFSGEEIIGDQSTAQFIIEDDDNAELAFSAPSFSIVEDGTPIAAVTVTRTGSSLGAVSAFVQLSNGSATEGSDYFDTGLIPVNFGTNDIAPKTIFIPIVNDSLQEGSETINLRLVNPTGEAIIATQSRAVLTILNNDFIGGPGHDSLTGSEYNDTIIGHEGNDRLVGRGGNDRFSGNAGDDVLIGVDSSSAAPGRGEIDRLVGGGGGGSDSFHLGNANAFYYTDANGTTDGRADYAHIVDFSSQVDSIVLRGSASRYRLGGSPAGLPSGTAIYLLTSGQTDELIGIVEGVSGLRLSERYFRFV